MSRPPSLHVLVVEDDEDTLANLCDILDLDEHRTETAGTASEVLIRDQWSATDVVILDRRLPDGTADDLLPVIRRKAPAAAVIIVTGFSDVEGAITALRRGAFDYLLKPINPDALRASLNRIAEARRAERELKVRADQQSVVAELGRLALLSPDIPWLIRETAERVVGTMQVDCAGILELLPTRDAFVLRAGAGWQAGTVGTTVVSAELQFQSGYTLQTGSPVVVEDFDDEHRFTRAPLLLDHDVHSGISVVIHGESQPYGVLGAYSRKPRRFTKADADFLQAVANVLAASLHRVQSEHRAVQSERLAAIGQMVTGLAHESRNALQRSQACLEMLSLEVEDRPQALELVGRIQRAQDHLHHLYEEVRSYATPIRIQRTPTDLGEVWRETWANLEFARRDRTITLRESLTSPDLVCQVDRHAIEQVFRNIFENAIAACPDPAEVVVEAGETSIDVVRHLRIAIRDDGPGLTPEQRSRIFEPFFTTKTHGTGLGMAIARRIIEAHGGRIDLADPTSRGAEIVLRIPRA